MYLMEEEEIDFLLITFPCTGRCLPELFLSTSVDRFSKIGKTAPKAWQLCFLLF